MQFVLKENFHVIQVEPPIGISGKKGKKYLLLKTYCGAGMGLSLSESSMSFNPHNVEVNITISQVKKLRHRTTELVH